MLAQHLARQVVFQGRAAQVIGSKQIAVAPLGRDAVHLDFPDFERGARAQAQAVAAGFQVQRFIGVAAPLDAFFDFAAKPQHGVVHGLGQGHGQQAAGDVLVLCCRGVQGAEVVAGEDWLAAVLEPLVQRASVFRGGALTITVQHLVFQNRHAAGASQIHQGFGHLCQAFKHGCGALHHGGVEAHQGIHLGFALTADFQGLQGADLQGQHLTDGLAGHAQFMGDMQRLAMPATDESPQALAIHQRDAHGRQHAHVLHVLAVNRRHAAQYGPAQIQCLAGVRAQCGNQRHRLVIGVRNNAQPVGAVQLAGLFRDVGGREKHAVEQFHRWRGGFRDDLAVAFILKTVDQNPVVARQCLDLAHADFIQCGEGLGPLQALQHTAQVAHLAHGAVNF